ncbi:MAG: 30S ribosome-binding factor RbfA [Holosporales bacterium]
MSRRFHEPGPSQRQLRVGEEVRHLLAEMLSREAYDDPVLQRASVTVTEVRISPDFRHARVYVMPLGGKEVAAVVASLNAQASHFRGQLGRQLTIKYIPKLFFTEDTTFEAGGRIDALMRNEKVARDLTPRGEGDASSSKDFPEDHD